MDRGVIVGGSLIAASFLVAVLLNRSAHEEANPPQAAPEPPAQLCEDSARTPPEPGLTPEAVVEGCKRPPAEPPKP